MKKSKYLITIFFINLFIFSNIFVYMQANNNANVLNEFESDYQGWKIEDLQMGGDFILMWVKDENGKDHVYTWGENEFGQLSNHSTAASNNWNEIVYYTKNDSEITTLPDDWKIEQIDLGFNNGMAVVDDSNGSQHLYVWGSNTYGEFGIGTEGYSTVPLDITDYYKAENYQNYEITDIAISSGVSQILLTDDFGNYYLYGCGYNEVGNLGIGNFQNTSTYKQAILPDEMQDDNIRGVYNEDVNWDGEFENAIEVVDSSFLLVSDGNSGEDALYGTGSGRYSATFADDRGDANTFENSNQFAPISLPNEYYSNNWEIKSFYNCSYYYVSPTYDDESTFYRGIVFTNSLDSSIDQQPDKLYVWGSNMEDSIGDDNLYLGDFATTMQEVEFPDNYLFIDYAGGDYHSSYAVLSNNQGTESIYYWGHDDDNELSTLYDPEHQDYVDTPTEINYSSSMDLNNEKVVKMGYSYFNGCILTENYTTGEQKLYFWGDNSNLLIDLQSETVRIPNLVYSSSAFGNFDYNFNRRGTLDYNFYFFGDPFLINNVVLTDNNTGEVIIDPNFNATYSTRNNITIISGEINNLKANDDYSLSVNYGNYFNSDITENLGSISGSLSALWVSIIILLIFLPIIGLSIWFGIRYKENIRELYKRTVHKKD